MKFTVILKERLVRGTNSTYDRWWAIMNGRFEAGRMHVSYPGSEKLIRDYAQKLNAEAAALEPQKEQPQTDREYELELRLGLADMERDSDESL